MTKDDFNKMDLLSTNGKSVWDELVGQTINLPGATWSLNNTPIDIKVETIVSSYNYPMFIVNNAYLATFQVIIDLCKKKSLLRSIK